jgi:RHS repeat-associated protein
MLVDHGCLSVGMAQGPHYDCVESGLEYAYYRYYSQAAGRFISPDPITSNVGNPQSLNRYTYVLNDSLNLTDPRGLLTFNGNCLYGILGNPGFVFAGPCPGEESEKGEKFEGGDWYYGFDSGTQWNVHGLKCPDGGYRPVSPNTKWNINCGIAQVTQKAQKQSLHQRLNCAANFGNGISIAGVLDIDEKGHPVGSFLRQVVFREYSFRACGHLQHFDEWKSL